ncbi:MAG TPA: hypothetical protein VN934_03540 [Candidatus Tumulicola sp.]|nr:hypothetical protein [Candidatus Tumulicola sp.]
MISGSEFVVAVAFKAMSSLGVTATRDAAAIAGLNRQVVGLNRNIALTGRSLPAGWQGAGPFSNIARGATMAKGALAGLGALVIGGGLVAAVNNAADLELALKKIQLASGATGDEMANMNTRVVALSAATAQSATTIAGQMLAVLQAGMSFKQLNSEVGTTLIKFGDIMQLTRGMNPAQASTMAVQIAHLFAKYQPGEIKTMTDLIYKMQQVQPEGLNRVLTQSAYGVPFASVAGVSIKDTMMLLTMMGQVGLLRGKGGTGLANTILQSLGVQQLTGHRQAARDKAKAALGLTIGGADQFMKPDGSVDVMKILHIVAAASLVLPRKELLKDIYNTFGMQGGRFVATMMRPEALEQQQRTWTRMGQMEGLDEAQRNVLRSTFRGTMQLITTDIATDLGQMALPVLQYLHTPMKRISDQLGRLGVFFATHRDVAIAAFTTSLVAAVGSATYASIWLLRLAGSINTVALASARATAANATNVASGFRGKSALGAMSWAWGLGPAAEGAAAGGAGAAGGGLLRLLGPVGVIIGLLALAKNLPDISAHVKQWWFASWPKVEYTIAYGIGATARLLVQGLQYMFQQGMGAIRGASSPKGMVAAMLLANPLTSAAGQTLLSQAIDDAMANVPKPNWANMKAAQAWVQYGWDQRDFAKGMPHLTGWQLPKGFANTAGLPGQFHVEVIFNGPVSQPKDVAASVEKAISDSLVKFGKFGASSTGSRSPIGNLLFAGGTSGF